MRNQNYSPLRGFAVRGGTSASFAGESTMAGLIETALMSLRYPGEEITLDVLSLRQAHNHELDCQRTCSFEDLLDEISEATNSVVRRLPSGDIRLRKC